MLPGVIQRSLRHLPHVLALYLGKKFSIGGVNLVVTGQDHDRAEALRGKVNGALQLISGYAPKCCRRVQKFIPNILVARSHAYNAVYISDLRLCEFSSDFALSEGTCIEQIAMALVHEATHGYLCSRGISYTGDKRVRVESICIRAEVAFARRLPQADELIAAAKRCLEYRAEYWTNTSFLQREIDAFTKAGMPKFLIRIYERRARRDLGES
jgi:hypothetical protein